MKPAPPHEGEQYRIMLVEDDDDIARLALACLAPLGFECHHAINGDDALASFQDINPHLMLLDIMMPGTSGLDVLRQVREGSTIPVIMMTALDEKQQGLESFKIGADDYISKPFDYKLMTARIIAQLRRAYRYDVEDPAAAPTPKVDAEKEIPRGYAACGRCGHTAPQADFEYESFTGARKLRCPNCKETDYVTYSLD